MGCAQSTPDTEKETAAMIKKLLEGESVEQQIESLKQKAKESLDAGDHKKAAEYLIKAGQLAASDDRNSGQSGRDLILQGKFDEAKEQCQKAYNRDPFNFMFAVNLGHSYLLTGDAAAA
jgi:Flp pilus assembly protein TadD